MNAARRRKTKTVESEESVERNSETAFEQASESSTDSKSELERYMTFLRRYPVLKDNATCALLFTRLRNDPDRMERLKARDLIVYGNARLVVSIALRFRGRGLDLMDLMQEGQFGLLRAIEKFDPDMGFRFSTYATSWVRQAMGRAIANHSGRGAMRLPVHMQEHLAFIKRELFFFHRKNGCWPTDLELYKTIKASGKTRAEKITLVEIVEIHRFLVLGDVSSLDQEYGDGEEGYTLLSRQPDPEQNVEVKVEARRTFERVTKAVAKIAEAIDSLGTRNAMVLRLRLGLGDFDKLTLEEIAERYELTRERIRQIEAAGFGRLKEMLGITQVEIEQVVDTYEELAKLLG